MKKFNTKFLTCLTLLALSLTTQAQPTIDGSDTGDTQYMLLANWTQADTGFGDHGIVELKGFADATNLYLILKGECESNFNDLFLFINTIEVADGLASGNNLPSGTDALSPFNGQTGILDMEVDYGIRLTGDATQAYPSVINYRSGGNTDTFLETIANDGTPFTEGDAPYAGIEIAYKDAGSLSARAGDEGWEMKIPLSVIGAAAGNNFELFAMYGNNDFISANTLPEIPGQSGNNLGSNPNFNGITGSQLTSAAPLPIELKEFVGIRQGGDVNLSWTTYSEQNNHYFDVQRSLDLYNWTSIERIEGAGNSYEALTYDVVDENTPSTQLYYRLVQVDYDGANSVSEIVSINAIQKKAAVQVYPSPMGSELNIQLNIPLNSKSTVALYNLNGQLLHQTLLEEGATHLQLNTSALSAGIYFININGKDISFQQKLIK